MLSSSSGNVKGCFAPSHPGNSAPSALCETPLIVNDSHATSTALCCTAELRPCFYGGKTVLKHQPKQSHLFTLHPTNAAPQRRQTGTPYGQIMKHPVIHPSEGAIGKENSDGSSPAVGAQETKNWLAAVFRLSVTDRSDRPKGEDERRCSHWTRETLEYLPSLGLDGVWDKAPRDTRYHTIQPCHHPPRPDELQTLNLQQRAITSG